MSAPLHHPPSSLMPILGLVGSLNFTKTMITMFNPHPLTNLLLAPAIL